MIDSVGGKYRCPECDSADFAVSTTQWRCGGGHVFGCVAGMPKLYREERVGAQDRKLRDTFYDGVFGRFYRVMMPFIVMPVRPWAIARPYWAGFAAVWLLLLVLCGLLVSGLSKGEPLTSVAPGALLFLAALFLARQRYLLHLLLIALPTWLSLRRTRFAPAESFPEVHARVLEELRGRGGHLQVLDISTGSCNSLHRHGWMTLDADYTAIDLSETMLRQGAEMMSRNGVPVDLVLGDAADLPFQSERFDVVLSYGAVNGLSDPTQAIAEMARVAKPGGVLLFLDEQMYEGATPVQRAYFHKVLSAHNVIHHCPVETFPPSLAEVRVSQVYEFYYICTARKAA